MGRKSILIFSFTLIAIPVVLLSLMTYCSIFHDHHAASRRYLEDQIAFEREFRSLPTTKDTTSHHREVYAVTILSDGDCGLANLYATKALYESSRCWIARGVDSISGFGPTIPLPLIFGVWGLSRIFNRKSGEVESEE